MNEAETMAELIDQLLAKSVWSKVEGIPVRRDVIAPSCLIDGERRNESDIVLQSQGIREHVCEILEGGTEAFKKRENKYAIGGSK